MALDVLSDWPTYLVEELPQRRQHLLLCPSARWRAVINDVEAIGSDLLLETVSRITASGEKSPERISELLQISKDLVQHLLAQLSATRTTLSLREIGSSDFDQPRELLSQTTRAVWVYRDMATQEIWRDISNEAPPVPLRRSDSRRAIFEHGTAGKPIKSRCLLLPPGNLNATAPTDFDLMQITSASRQDSRRAQVVGDPEFCFVARPVVNNEGTIAVQSLHGNIYIGLTRYLENIAATDSFISRWIAQIPEADRAVSGSMQLDQAVSRLRELLKVEVSDSGLEHFRLLEMQNELVLRRYVDYYRYALGAKSEVKMTRDIVVWSQIGKRIGLSPEEWTALVGASDESLGGQVALLILEQVHAEQDYDAVGLMSLVRCTVSIISDDSSAAKLSNLVDAAREIIELCNELIAQEEVHGQQAK